jgi:hypothetical protein
MSAHSIWPIVNAVALLDSRAPIAKRPTVQRFQPICLKFAMALIARIPTTNNIAQELVSVNE